MPVGSPLRSSLRTWRLLPVLAVLATITVVEPASGVVGPPLAHPTAMEVSCQSPVAVGDPSRCTARVVDLLEEIATTPRGGVSFSSNNTGSFPNGNTCSLTEVVKGESICQVQVTYVPGTTGTHVIKGSYGGTLEKHTPSDDTGTVVGIIVSPTTTAVSCTPSTVARGVPTTCRATITDASPSSQPSGPISVSFASDGPGAFNTKSCSVSFRGGVANEQVSCTVTYTTSQATDAPHRISASFTGGSNHTPSQGSTEVHSERAAVQLVCEPAALVLDEASTCTATVTDIASPAAAPRGKVEFSTDGVGAFRSNTPTCRLGPVGDDRASCALVYVPSEVGSGHHRIEAAYLESASQPPSVDDAVIDVLVENPERERTGMTVVCDPAEVVAVSATTFCTATVAAETTPTGVVQFSTDGPGGFAGNNSSCILQPSEEFEGEASCGIGYVASGVGTGSHRIGASYQGDGGHRPSRASTLLLVAASIRYAAPQGRGVDPCADPDDPCTFFTAADSGAPGTTIKAGDLVVMEPGSYSDSAGDLGPLKSVTLKAGARLRGAGGQARPVIALNEPILGPVPSMGLTVLPGSTASHLEFNSATAPTAIFIEGGVVEDVIARSAASGPITGPGAFPVVCNQTGGLVRDSVCLASGAQAAAFGTRLASDDDSVIEFQNVTAISTGPGGNGVQISVRSTGSGPQSFDAHGAGVIAAGSAADVFVTAESGSTNVDLELEHSDYGTAPTAAVAGASASVTPAGSGTNITAEPLFAEDGFHQLANSPTVDAGFMDVLTGARDIDGQRRPLGSGPDIGADERPAASVTELVCDRLDLRLGQTSTCTVTVEDTSLVPSKPTGPVRLSVDGGEGELRDICTLAPTGRAKARCEVHYTPTTAGSGTHELTALYESDADLDLSQDTEAIGVTDVPPSVTQTALRCEPAAVKLGDASTCTATVEDISGTPSTPTGIVEFAVLNGDEGTFAPDDDCLLNGPENGRVASCSVTYGPAAVGSAIHEVRAAYEADDEHEKSQGIDSILVSDGISNETSTTFECEPVSVETRRPTHCVATVKDVGGPDFTPPAGKVVFDTDGPGNFSVTECEPIRTGRDSSACEVDYTPSLAGVHTLEAGYFSADDEHIESTGFFELEVTGDGGNLPVTTVECLPSPVELNHASTCEVTLEDVSDAPIAPTGVVSFEAEGEGDFSGDGTCTLAVPPEDPPAAAPGDEPTASCQIAYTPTAGLGARAITALYEGDLSHSPSFATTELNVIEEPGEDEPNETTTELTCLPDPVEVDNPTACTAEVTGIGPDPSAPEGEVEFTTADPGAFTPITCDLEDPVGNTASCEVDYTPAEATPALHTLKATYKGTVEHKTSEGTFDLDVTEEPGEDEPNETTTELTCLPDPVEVDNPTACTAEVTGIGPDPSAPEGEVEFTTADPGAFTPITCDLEDPVGNTASCEVDYTPAEATPALHTLKATYKGSPEHKTSEGTFDLDVTEEPGDGGDENPTDTTLNCQPRTVILGGGSVCTAIVEDTAPLDRSAPTGIVELESDSGTFANVCTLTPRGQERARCQTVYNPADPGDQEVLAVYDGDEDHQGSDDSNEITVDGPNGGHKTATALECELSPMILGGVSICTVNVSDLDANPTTPGGGVFFASDGDGDFSSGGCLLFAVARGEARCQLIYTPSQARIHRITAIYTGAPGHEPSRNTDLVDVDPPNGGHETTTALECEPADVPVRGATTCTATVTDESDVGPTDPTSAVVFASDSPGTFGIGGCQLGQPDGDGEATCEFTYTPLQIGSGTHRIAAAYVGDAGHEPSPLTSDQVTVTAPAPPQDPPQQPEPPQQPKPPQQPGVTPPAAVLAAPNTVLRKKPRKRTARRKAMFKFVADQPGSTFQCKLDKKPFKPCRSPWKKKVKPGRHTFRVRAVNARGAADPTPAVFKWKVGGAAKASKSKR